MSIGSTDPGVAVSSCASAVPAATVIVLRDAPAGPEVLLLKRDARLRFMPNLWVFPGGRMDVADTIAQPETVWDDAATMLVGAVCRCRMLPVDPLTAAGLVVAATRELREETGLTLHGPTEGTPKSSEKGWSEFSAMIYWARWITPSASPRRFDTHFFAGCVRPDQQLKIAEDEASEAAWLSPSAAVLAIENGAMESSGPTLTVLRDLRRAVDLHETARAILKNERGRYVTPILPKMVSSDTGTDLLLPWDPEYEAGFGAGLRLESDVPEHWRLWPSRMQVPDAGRAPRRLPDERA